MTMILKTAWTALAWLAAAWVPAMATPANTACIFDQDIVSTTRPDDHTILFNMRDHTVWKNTTQSLCFGLKNEIGGFTYQPTNSGTQQLCSNQVTIRLNTFGNFCQLGDFTRVK